MQDCCKLKHQEQKIVVIIYWNSIQEITFSWVCKVAQQCGNLWSWTWFCLFVCFILIWGRKVMDFWGETYLWSHWPWLSFPIVLFWCLGRKIRLLAYVSNVDIMKSWVTWGISWVRRSEILLCRILDVPFSLFASLSTGKLFPSTSRSSSAAQEPLSVEQKWDIRGSLCCDLELLLVNLMMLTLSVSVVCHCVSCTLSEPQQY